MTDRSRLVRYETRRGVATLTFDSPHNRNALSTPLMDEALAGLERALSDPTVRAVVLTHTGSVFCSGIDLAETEAARAAGQVPAVRLGDLLVALWESPKPVVARIAGAARGGGLGVIAACDIAVCTEQATFAFSEVRLGVIPAVISATVLRRLAPRAAAELYLTGDVFDGATAARIGLVTCAVPDSELETTLTRLTDSLLRGAPEALAGAKQLLQRPLSASVQDDVAALTALSARYFLSEEGREGIAAFREKRLPRWVPTDP